MSTARALPPARRVAAALAAAALAAVGVVAADVPAVTTVHSAPSARLASATTGTVERVAGGVLVLRDGAGDLQRLVLAAGATVVRGGRRVALADLRLGDLVTA